MGTVVRFNPQGVSVANDPGSMIAASDGSRRRLLIQNDGNMMMYVFPKSGTPPFASQAITLFPLGDYLQLSVEEDGDLVAMEWWGISVGNMPAFYNSMEVDEE